MSVAPQTLASVMQPSREELEWPLSQMDREVCISFSSDFNFSLAALVYKGICIVYTYTWHVHVYIWCTYHWWAKECSRCLLTHPYMCNMNLLVVNTHCTELYYMNICVRVCPDYSDICMDKYVYDLYTVYGIMAVWVYSTAGFSHPLSTVRTRTQELLTALFFIHSPDVSG